MEEETVLLDVVDSSDDEQHKQRRRRKSSVEDADRDYEEEEEDMEYAPEGASGVQESKRVGKRGTKRKSNEDAGEGAATPSRASTSQAKPPRRKKRKDSDDAPGETPTTRPTTKEARSPAAKDNNKRQQKPKTAATKQQGSKTKSTSGAAESSKPTNSEDFFKRKDFVNHYFSAVWTVEKKTKSGSGSNEKTLITEEGCVSIEWDKITLMNMNGKPVGNTQLIRKDPEEAGEDERIFLIKGKKQVEVLLASGQQLHIGTKQVQLVEPLSADDFRDGTFFLKQCVGHEIRQKAQHLQQQQQQQQLLASPLVRKVSDGPRFRLAAARKPRPGTFRVRKIGEEKEELETASHNHDPDGPNALVLYRASKFDTTKSSVVVDPKLCKYLRPHQREGVQFLYNCITGQGGFKGNGAILADEMGLGKTLQSITLLWTVLRQGPEAKPLVKKAMIVAPSSLVKNWYKEVHKWLGPESLRMLAIGENKTKISSDLDDFKKCNIDLLIISYTQALRHIDILCETKELDLIICDEGHRLKNSEIKTTKALSKLPTKRKIILSGTPIQNDLDEFYSMIEVVNPGILGEREKFRKVFEEPIMAGRQPTATEKEKAIGDARSKMLSNLTSIFILRRTSDILSKYLPPKVEYTVFCRMAPLQKAIYRTVVRERLKVALESGRRDDALSSITLLKKLCNHPALVYSMCQKDKEANKTILDAFPPKFQPLDSNPQVSGKFLLLDSLLREIRKRSKDRIVIVSNYTQTLRVIAHLCRYRSWGYFQLDGSTPVKQRQNLVDAFNNPFATEFIFLLSSKAGGVGLNLIGANRNPANDLQAMARVHRDGQKKRVFVYRFLSTGTIEEKIYQRQITKQSLSTSVVDAKADTTAANQFSLDDLKDLFKYRSNTLCETHDLLGCKCCLTKVEKENDENEEDGFIDDDDDDADQIQAGFIVRRVKKKDFRGEELNEWDHFPSTDYVQDEMLKRAAQDTITFIFAKENEPGESEVMLQEEGTNREDPEDDGDGKEEEEDDVDPDAFSDGGEGSEPEE